MGTSCTFSKAWRLLKDKIDEGKTSWGKLELKNLMFECLHDAALEQEMDTHYERDD